MLHSLEHEEKQQLRQHRTTIYKESKLMHRELPILKFMTFYCSILLDYCFKMLKMKTLNLFIIAMKLCRDKEMEI